MVTNQNVDAAIRTLKRLIRQCQEPVGGHYKDDPFTTLIGCLLGLRTQDATTHGACRRLFRLARTPQTMQKLPTPIIERAIYPVGFYRTKARCVKETCRTLIERYGGRVPDDLDELLSINGVGRKTANLVITLAFRKPGICVDTHVHRITNRWGYVATKTPEETEFALRKQLPTRHWRILNDLLVTFGQNLCHPTSPWCSRCPLTSVCARIGVTRSR